MENQHRLITGYRELDQNEIDAMNKVKALAAKVGELADDIETNLHTLDRRWFADGKTDLQKGFMALVRSIAKPTTF